MGRDHAIYCAVYLVVVVLQGLTTTETQMPSSAGRAAAHPRRRQGRLPTGKQSPPNQPFFKSLLVVLFFSVALCVLLGGADEDRVGQLERELDQSPRPRAHPIEGAKSLLAAYTEARVSNTLPQCQSIGGIGLFLSLGGECL